MDNPETVTTLNTQDTERRQAKQNAQQTEKISNMDLTKNRWWTQELAKGKNAVPLIRHPPCYSYRQGVLDTTKEASYVCLRAINITFDKLN